MRRCTVCMTARQRNDRSQEDTHDEVTALARGLSGAGVGVSVFDDHTTHTPDSVFPNNWFSTHPDGSVALYPMYATNRRTERRADIIEDLKRTFLVRRVIDYSAAEYDEQFLEGTGAMVLDHDARLAYACRSNRLSPELLSDFCVDHGYEPCAQLRPPANLTGSAC